MQKKLIAQHLHDVLVIAHDVYKNKKKNQVVELIASTTNIGYRADEVGLCLFVQQLCPSYKCNDLLRDCFFDLYGTSIDPFDQFQGGSYYNQRLNYKVRSREALKIAKYLAKKYNF